MRFQGHRRRRQEDDGYSNNKRSNGSNTHPLKSAILISRASRSEVRHLREPDSRRREARGDVANPSHGSAGIFSRQIFPSMSNAVNSPIALTGHVVPTKQHRHAEVDSSGPKVRFIPSSEFLAEFVEWRQSRMKILSSKCTFDRWYEALFKEQIWHQWMLNGLVKSMDIPSMEAWIFRSARKAWIFRSARKVSSKTSTAPTPRSSV